MPGTKKKHKIRKRGLAKVKPAYIVLPFLVIASIFWFVYSLFHLQPADDWFDGRASDMSKIVLPDDDAPHLAQIEWWYYNGHLVSESGKHFSFHDAVFLVNGVQNYMISHVSFNDHQTGKRFTDQYRTGGNSSTGTENSFEFKQNRWLMAGGNGHDRLKVNASDFGFNLQLSATTPPVFHGNNGIISLYALGSSYYYSRTRMGITGTIHIGNTTEPVTGVSWFDHQWGDFSVGQLSWDWFSLQLDNKVDVMIYQLRDRSGQPVLYMASVTQNGNTDYLPESEFTASSGKKWHSVKSGVDYPLEWKISIPEKNINITTASMIKDSEFDARLTTYNTYWEGPVSIQGTHTGHGFMELQRLPVDD